MKRGGEKMKVSYPGVFVRGFLPFLGHGLWWSTSEETSSVEKAYGNNDILHYLDEDLRTLTLGGLSTGSMGSEGNPVSCRDKKRVSINNFLTKTNICRSFGAM